MMRIAGSHSCDKFFLAFIFHPAGGANFQKGHANLIVHGFSSILTGYDYIILLGGFTTFFLRFNSFMMRLCMTCRTKYHKMLWIIPVEHIGREVNCMQLQCLTLLATFGTYTMSLLTERLFQGIHFCRMYYIKAHMKDHASENQGEDARAGAKRNH